MYLKPSGIGLDWPGLLVVAWAVWPQLVGGQALPGTYLASTLTQAGAGDTNQLATSYPADHSLVTTYSYQGALSLILLA